MTKPTKAHAWPVDPHSTLVNTPSGCDTAKRIMIISSNATTVILSLEELVLDAKIRPMIARLILLLCSTYVALLRKP